jgi:hypothetical protein
MTQKRLVKTEEETKGEGTFMSDRLSEADTCRKMVGAQAPLLSSTQARRPSSRSGGTTIHIRNA